MALKNVLLHVDDSPPYSARLDLAIDLAVNHNACLHGLYVIPQPHYAPRNAMAERKADEAAAMFAERTGRAGIETTWRCVECHVTGVSQSEIINSHAYYADLAVVGQTNHSAAYKGTQDDLPERLILASGRPVLVVPYAGSFTTVGKRVMVAWKAGRESTRAVNDALPFLSKAQQVHIAAVDTEAEPPGDAQSSCANICAYLSRHHVNATAERIVAVDGNVGDQLLNLASDKGIDLLVTGAYTHAHRGVALGAVAGHLLRYSPVPLLMSH